MKGFISAVDKVNNVVFNFLAIIFGLIAVLAAYQVFARYILGDPLTWSEGIIRYLMIWVVLLGMGVALRKGMLISVEVVLYLVPPLVNKIMSLIIILLSMVFLSLLIKYGLNIMTNLAGQTTGALEIPVSWLYASIPVGGFYSLINCLVVLMELPGRRHKEEDSNGSPIIH